MPHTSCRDPTVSHGIASSRDPVARTPSTLDLAWRPWLPPRTSDLGFDLNPRSLVARSGRH